MSLSGMNYDDMSDAGDDVKEVVHVQTMGKALGYLQSWLWLNSERVNLFAQIATERKYLLTTSKR